MRRSLISGSGKRSDDVAGDRPAAVKRAWERKWRHDLRFVVKVEGGSFDPDVELLVDQSSSISRRLSATGNTVEAEQWLRTTAGWSAVLVGVERIDDALEWLEAFSGLCSYPDGAIVGGRAARGTGLGYLAPEPTAFAAYTTGDLRTVPKNDRGPLWFVDPGTTRFIAEKIQSFGYTRGCRQYLTRLAEWTVELDGLDWEPAFAQAAAGRYASIDVVFAHRKPTRLRLASLSPGGECVYQVVDPGMTLEQRIAMVRKTLLWTPPRTDVAFIRTERGNWNLWDAQTQLWPYVRRTDIRYNRPLLASMVPDVNGIQLLTKAHLDRAHDLSGWRITELAGPRYLVEARDLGPWYDGPEVDAETLAHGRADFGQMIMTKDLIAANDPWRD